MMYLFVDITLLKTLRYNMYRFLARWFVQTFIMETFTIVHDRIHIENDEFSDVFSLLRIRFINYIGLNPPNGDPID